MLKIFAQSEQTSKLLGYSRVEYIHISVLLYIILLCTTYYYVHNNKHMCLHNFCMFFILFHFFFCKLKCFSGFERLNRFSSDWYQPYFSTNSGQMWHFSKFATSFLGVGRTVMRTFIIYKKFLIYAIFIAHTEIPNFYIIF